MGDLSVEVYGFVFWLLAYIGYGFFVVWAFVPSHLLEKLFPVVFPSKYWALILPVYICFAAGIVILMYHGVNLLYYEPLDTHDYPTKEALRLLTGAPTEEERKDFRDENFSVPSPRLYARPSRKKRRDFFE
eukprot:TRINITY_DN160021_c0_g1_i1.p1 TRINITY_DN160021_c0_g1~~TRINITY_DN160021_c0_g1_i1.p1  ORF type:complete len:131 (+),score=13.35 TRINITY_DN160021_c0_g1_i1:85-477(+)